jgi:hypothetical protein
LPVTENRFKWRVKLPPTANPTRFINRSPVERRDGFDKTVTEHVLAASPAANVLIQSRYIIVNIAV